jgi:glycine cleavage system transcriptional repressor
VHRLFAVAVVGRDRPGIVADVSGRLLELGANVEDVVTSLLSGHFALMLVCAAPAETSLAALQERLGGLPDGLQAAAWDVDERPERPRPSHLVSVYGPDQPGIVHAVSKLLADRAVNICDMTCRLGGGVYALTLEVELPAGLPVERLEADLRGGVAALRLEVTIGPIDAAVL